MKEGIYRRKSIRNYQREQLPDEIIQKIKQKITELKPLMPNIKYQITINEKVEGLFKVEAPHYLAFYSEEKPGYLENIGFVGQMLSLFMTSLGLGSCWLGAAKSVGEESELPYIACMAFGKAAEELYRQEKDFKRKANDRISNTTNEIINAARLAPSAVNIQDWYFYQEKNCIHCYYQKNNFLTAKLLGSNLSEINLGIAMCHMILLLENNYEVIEFREPPSVKNSVYFRTIVIK